MAVVVACLSMVLIYCMARTIAIQRTIHTFDLFRRETSKDPAGNRARAMILLGIYVTRLNSAFLVGILVYLVTARASAWYYGTAIVVLCWIGSFLVGSADFLRLGSPEMIRLLIAELERRRVRYARGLDATRLHAVDELLLRIRSARRV